MAGTVRLVMIGCVILVAVVAPCSAHKKRAISEQFHVSISYPESWAEIPVGVPNEIFRLWSEH